MSTKRLRRSGNDDPLRCTHSFVPSVCNLDPSSNRMAGRQGQRNIECVCAGRANARSRMGLRISSIHLPRHIMHGETSSWLDGHAAAQPVYVAALHSIFMMIPIEGVQGINCCEMANGNDSSPAPCRVSKHSAILANVVVRGQQVMAWLVLASLFLLSWCLCMVAWWSAAVPCVKLVQNSLQLSLYSMFTGNQQCYQCICEGRVGRSCTSALPRSVCTVDSLVVQQYT